MKPLSEHDHYETLEVPRGASLEEVERAYRLALATYSEDSLAGYSVFEAGDAEHLRERIEIAHRVLSDPETRRSYDAELEGGDPPDPAASAPEVFAATPARPAEPITEPLDAFEALDESEGDWDGARLHRARMRQGVTLDEIADVTKVNPTYLQFIEEEHFDGLPAAVYVRGFVQGFAGCLGLDSPRVATSYVQRLEEKRGKGRRGLFSRR